jgi:hypothetical protein
MAAVGLTALGGPAPTTTTSARSVRMGIRQPGHPPGPGGTLDDLKHVRVWAYRMP